MLGQWITLKKWIRFLGKPPHIIDIRKEIFRLNISVTTAKYFHSSDIICFCKCLIVSTPELLKAEVERLHGCAIFLRICAIFFTFEHETGKISTFFYDFGTIWQHSSKNSFFYGILGSFLCAKLMVWKHGCAKEFYFRRSALFFTVGQHVCIYANFLVHDMSMTCSWIAHDLLMTCLWSAHDFLMTCSWLAHDLHMTCSWLAHDLLMTCSRLTHNLLMTCSWLDHDLLITCSTLAHDSLMTSSWLSYEILMTFSWLTDWLTDW